ncbi:hypothetical protein [Stenotrophomonas sp.]|nr:hypothetical protein [Stenotrophomonas sp.]
MRLFTSAAERAQRRKLGDLAVMTRAASQYQGSEFTAYLKKMTG